MGAETCVSPVVRWGSCLILPLLFGLGVMPLQAAPSTPDTDAAVLEVLPLQWSSGATADIRRLRAAWQANPDDQANLTALVRAYMEVGREQADPRYYGYAEAVLQPWWTAANPPADILLLRATLRQHAHAYEAAVQDLQQLVQQHPNQPQGWLTLAVVESERGEYAEAKKSCAALAVHASTWYASLCYSQVLSVSGDADKAYRLQATLLPTLTQAQTELRQWILTMQGETALRLGKTREAGQHFEAALAEPRTDHYLLRVYSDYLLSQQRPLEVIKLLQDKGSDDALLLRLAIASRDAGQTAETRRYQQQLEARYAAIRLRGSVVDAKDEALYWRVFNEEDV